MIEKCLRNHRQMRMQKVQKILKNIQANMKNELGKDEKCHFLMGKLKKPFPDINIYDIVVILEIEEIFDNQILMQNFV